MARKNKDEILEVEIKKMVFPNKGVGVSVPERKTVTVKNTLPGQRLMVKATKKHGAYEGRVLEKLAAAKEELQPECPDFGICGGCTYQNITYEYELALKESMVADLMEKAGISGYKYLGVVPAPRSTAYRNKMEFSFGDMEKGGELALGMRKRASFYEVVTSLHCNIVDEDFRKILLCVLNYFQESGEAFYHKATHEGSLRHLIIRKGGFSEEILVNLVTTAALNTPLEPLTIKLTGLCLQGGIAGILHTVNNSVADVVKCESMSLLHGTDFFYENILGLSFKITPFSFFQTNSHGAERLYGTVKQFITETGGRVVFDLYCGTGTIAQIAADAAERVVGIEIVEEAAAAATQNAGLNGIDNCSFIAGDVLKKIDELEGIQPDLIIVDPPRDGIHPKAIMKILNYRAAHIIYVSCNPASLARDLKIMCENGYTVDKLKLHDMFPRTYHVESVVLMSKV